MNVYSSSEAMNEYQKWKQLLNELQRNKLLSATVSHDGLEWCVLSGPDLVFDRAGFGATIADAIKDYLGPLIEKRMAS